LIFMFNKAQWKEEKGWRIGNPLKMASGRRMKIEGKRGEKNLSSQRDTAKRKKPLEKNKQNIWPTCGLGKTLNRDWTA